MPKGKIPVLTAVLLTAVSCMANRDRGSQPSGPFQRDDSPGFVILQYMITADTSGYTVELLERSFSKGRLKTQLQPAGHPSAGDLEYSILDLDSQPLHRAWITDPLRRTYETPDRDGTLSSQEVRLDSAGFILRLESVPGAKTIVIERHSNEKSENIHLLTHELQ
jgi:hypothetical protein